MSTERTVQAAGLTGSATCGRVSGGEIQQGWVLGCNQVTLVFSFPT